MGGGRGGGPWPHVCLQLLRDTSGGGQGDRQPAGRLAPCQLPSPRGQGDRQSPQIGGVVSPPLPAVGKDWGSVPCPPTAARVLQLARAACPACLGAAFAPGSWRGRPVRGGIGLGWQRVVGRILPRPGLPRELQVPPRGRSLPRPHAWLSPAQAWLRLYGYLPQPSRQMSTMRSAQTFSSALAEMQKFYGITVTGVLDEETKA